MVGRRAGVAICAAVLCLGVFIERAHAAVESQLVGVWRTVDDATGKDKSLVRITESGGVYSGHIEKLIDPDPTVGTVCDKCTDERKGQPLVGLSLIRNIKEANEAGLFAGGDIVDPKNGKTYALRLKLLDEGKRLQVRGYIGPFFRTQIWVRAD